MSDTNGFGFEDGLLGSVVALSVWAYFMFGPISRYPDEESDEDYWENKKRDWKFVLGLK